MSETMRDAFGKKLAEIGKTNHKLVVLDADVMGSTKSGYFAKEFPDRFFNCGVAEGNMAGVAGGLAACGYYPLINGFSIFISLKCIDQIRHDFCYNKLPLVIAGAYSGLSNSYDGASHQSIEDIAVFRALPNLEVIVPGDNKQAELALEYALGQTHPVYIRLTRNAAPDLPPVEGFLTKMPLLLKEGKDITIAATGLMAGTALAAAELLAKDGINAEVFSVPFVKPIKGDVLETSVKKTGKLVTIEEHSIVGGFGSACLEKITPAGLQFRYLALGMKDCFGETGSYGELLSAYALDVPGIIKDIKAFV
ncbi:MAG: 1-deoxy-D-xylulose-5-phosphate synthase [Spirochaetaceae bacterium]|jgi:transketolase|nr:1-deoxy-D-xylulose-5-phosphate synthase [Spirochaetaceae bacterium]